MGWKEVYWDGMVLDGMEGGVLGWDGIGWDGKGWDGMGREELGLALIVNTAANAAFGSDSGKGVHSHINLRPVLTELHTSKIRQCHEETAA